MAAERKYPPIETLDRIRKWCDMQERAHSDVRRKLSAWGVYGDESENIIAELISGNYLNEERYARAFARGKFRIKHWGWRKIESSLRAKAVSKFSIAAAREEYDEEDHSDVLYTLLLKKRNMLKESDPYKRKAKLMRFAAGKGYDFDATRQALERLGEEDA